MWTDIEDAYNRMASEPALTRTDGKSVDGTVKWTLYRVTDGVIRLDLKATIGSFAADDVRIR